MNESCINKNAPEYKHLLKQLDGNVELLERTYIYYGHRYPNLQTSTAIKKAVKFKKEVGSAANIAKEIRLYNQRNGTSHRFAEGYPKVIRPGVLELKMAYNYLPVNIANQVEREIQRKGRSKQTSLNFNEVIETPIKPKGFTPSNTFKWNSEYEGGFFNDEGDFKPLADSEDNIDFLLPEGPSRVQDVETLRRDKIAKEIVRLNHESQVAETVEAKKLALAKLQKFTEDLRDAEERRTGAGKLKTFESVLEKADVQLAEVELMLRDSAMSPENVVYAENVTSLWEELGRFNIEAKDHLLLTESEFETDEIREAFQLRGAKAATLAGRLSTIHKNHTLSFVKKYAGQNLTEEDVFKAIHDSSFGASQTLAMSRQDDTMQRSIAYAVDQANIKAKLEVEEYWKTTDDLIKKVLKKTGNSYDIFRQMTSDGLKTGRSVHRFSNEFFDVRKMLRNRAFYQRNAEGKVTPNQKAIEEYYEWINKNTITFDVRKLFPDSNMEEGTIPGEYLYNRVTYTPTEVEQHKKELLEQLGQKGYDYYIAKQEARIEKFKLEREAVYESYMSKEADFNENERLLLFQDWLKENSPYWELDMQENPLSRKRDSKTFHTPYGVRNYGISVPVRTSNGSLTGWYDDNFAKIEADEDLLAFHNYMNETLQTMRYLLPKEQQDLLGVGMIPFIQKNLIETWKEKGVMMGVKPFMDKFTELITTTDMSNSFDGYINPVTKEMQRKITIAFLKDNRNEINNLVKIKTIAHKQRTGSPATAQELNKYKREAQNEIAEKQSWDLGSVLKAFTLSALSYKHKSFIEAELKLVNQSFKQREEIKTNAKKEALKDSDGKVITEKNKLKRRMEQTDFFMNSDFYNQGSRKVEGATKNKKLTSEEKVRKQELEALIEAETNPVEKAFLQEELDKLGSVITASAIGDTVLKGFTLRGLGWNLPSAFSNIGFGIISNLIQASDNREYTQKNIKKGYILSINSIGKNLTFDAFKGVNQNALKIRTLIERYDLMQTVTKELFDTSNKSTLSKFKRFGPFSLQERSEYMNIAPMMIAIMDNIGMTKNEKGEDVSYWDALDPTGNLKEGYTSEVDQIKLIQKIKRVQQMNHGDYENTLQGKEKLFGRAALQFRTWMLEGFANRFESEKPDEILSYGSDIPYIRKGRYRSYTAGQLITTGAIAGSIFLPGIGSIVGAGLGALGGKFMSVKNEKGVVNDVLFTLKQLGRKLARQKTQFDEAGFTKHDAANMRKNMTELYMLVALAGVTLLLKSLAGGDDEEKKNYALNFLINQSTRLQTDINFYTNPLEAEKLLKTSLPVLQLVGDASKFFKDVFNLLDDEEENDYYQSPSVFEGDLKVVIDGLNMLPGFAQGIKIRKMVDKVYE